MLFAVAGQACCMAILAGTVSNGSFSAGIAAIVMLFLFNFFFGKPATTRLRARDTSLTNFSHRSSRHSVASACRVCAASHPYQGGISGICLKLDLHIPGGGDHACVDQKHPMEDLHLFRGVQRLLHPIDLLLL
jgi:hypothetical protein